MLPGSTDTFTLPNQDHRAILLRRPRQCLLHNTRARLPIPIRCSKVCRLAPLSLLVKGGPHKSDSKTPHRQQSLSTQKSELEELEARLRATEARLKDQHQQPRPSSLRSPLPGPPNDSRKNSQRLRAGLDGAFDQPDDVCSGSSSSSNIQDGSHTCIRRNEGSPLPAAMVEEEQQQQQQYDAPYLQSKSSSSDGRTDLTNQPLHDSLAITGPENMPPDLARHGDLRPKSAMTKEQHSVGNANKAGNGDTSLREKSPNKA